MKGGAPVDPSDADAVVPVAAEVKEYDFEIKDQDARMQQRVEAAERRRREVRCLCARIHYMISVQRQVQLNLPLQAALFAVRSRKKPRVVQAKPPKKKKSEFVHISTGREHWQSVLNDAGAPDFAKKHYADVFDSDGLLKVTGVRDHVDVVSVGQQASLERPDGKGVMLISVIGERPELFPKFEQSMLVMGAEGGIRAAVNVEHKLQPFDAEGPEWNLLNVLQLPIRGEAKQPDQPAAGRSCSNRCQLRTGRGAVLCRRQGKH